jgi:hypothetical protein
MGANTNGGLIDRPRPSLLPNEAAPHRQKGQRFTSQHSPRCTFSSCQKWSKNLPFIYFFVEK